MTTAMLTFEPPRLKDEIKTALELIYQTLDEDGSTLISDGYDLTLPDFPFEEYDHAVNETDEIVLSLPRCEETVTLTYRELIDLSKELPKGAIYDEVCYWSPANYYLRVSVVFARSNNLQDYANITGRDELTQTVKTEDGDLIVSLEEGLTPFAFRVCKDLYWDKYYPPYIPGEDCYIWIQHKAVPKARLDAIASAYIYELSSTVGIDLEPYPRHKSIEHWFSEDPGDTTLPTIRPLLHGVGIAELLKYYNEAIRVSDPLIKLLLLHRVLEYVSATVIRQQKIKRLRAKLQSPRALDPTADYILELSDIVEEMKESNNDKYAIIETVKECCEPTELARLSPDILKLKGITGSSDGKECEAALKQFGAMIVATRNFVAHAKANYKSVGEECPLNRLAEFVICLQATAQQAIRWYADRPETERVS